MLLRPKGREPTAFSIKGAIWMLIKSYSSFENALNMLMYFLFLVGASNFLSSL